MIECTYELNLSKIVFTQNQCCIWVCTKDVKDNLFGTHFLLGAKRYMMTFADFKKKSSATMTMKLSIHKNLKCIKIKNNEMGCSSMVEYDIVMSRDVGSIPSNPSFLFFF
mgnify:CR=1 FL=1